VPVGLLHVDLDERAGQLFFFPRSRRLTRPKADDDVLPPDRLAGAKRDVLDDAVALVEDAEDGNSLSHWRNPALPGCSGGGLTRGRQRNILLLPALAARGKRKRGQ
jgi:hypothetical protein